MSHEIYSLNGKDSMAYQGDKPWHGLGQELTPGQSLEVWANEAMLNWMVERANVRFFVPTGFRDQEIGFDIPTKHVLFRSDNYQELSVVSDKFKIVQPIEILEFYRDLIKNHGFEMETAGSLDNGKRVWALAKTGNNFTLPGNDRIESYLLLMTAYDCSLATTAKWVNTRVVCNNTLTMAYGENSLECKVRHNQIFNPKSIKLDMGLYDEAWQTFKNEVNKLANVKLSEEELVKFFISIYHNPENKDDNGEENFDDVPKRTLHKLLDLTLEGKGSQMESAKGTVWGAVNAVTEHYDHHAGRSKDTGLKSAWFGNGDNIKKQAYQKAIAIALDRNGKEIEVEVDQPISHSDNNLLDEIVEATING